MDIARLIKQAAVEAVGAEKPVAVMFGKAVGENGKIAIEIEQKMRLAGEQLITLNAVNYTAGDTVVLLREQGGQRFVIIGKV